VWYGYTIGVYSNGDAGGADGLPLTLNTGTCMAGTNFYYALSSKSATTLGYTAPTTLYVAYYSAAGCANSTYLGQDELTYSMTTASAACTALTSDVTLYGGLTFTFPTLALYDRCTSTCTSTCDASDLIPTATSDCLTGTDYWYAVSPFTLEPEATAGSTLSFAAAALCALIALLF